MDAKKMTAVEWLYSELSKNNISNDSIKSRIYKESEILKQAIAMEKEQIMKAARQCHFEGLRQTGKNSEEYIKYGNDYYNETFNK
jgi:hypothetical protein